MKFPHKERLIIIWGIIIWIVIVGVCVLTAGIVATERFQEAWNRYQLIRNIGRMEKNPTLYSRCYICGDVRPHKKMSGFGLDSCGNQIWVCRTDGECLDKYYTITGRKLWLNP